MKGMIIIKIRWLGNSAVEVDGDKKIIIDPNFKVDPEIEADIVLITHEHEDHIDPEKLAEISHSDTKVYGPQSVYDKFDIEGEIVKDGQEIEEDIKVMDIDCYNSEEAVAYFYNGLYHTADASVFPDPGEKIDLLFSACFNDHFAKYIESCIKLDPELAIPYHYDPEERQELLQAKGLSSKFEQISCNSQVLELGEEIEV